jgi:hypothetical protein
MREKTMYARIRRASGNLGLLFKERMKILFIIDIIFEFLDWLTDRKNYKKTAIEGLRFTGILIFSVLIACGLLFVIFAVIFFVKKSG